MVDEMDCLGSAKNSGATIEDETEFKFVLMIATAIIVLVTVMLLPIVAQVIAFVVILKWFKTKIFY